MHPDSLELRPPSHVERISVIRVLALRGTGRDDSPLRQVVQYWSDEGVLLAESDPDAPAAR